MNEQQCETLTTIATSLSPCQVSEIARIRQQIDLEYAAAQRGLTGLSSGTARHDFIHQRYATIGECAQRLSPLVGEDEAWEMVCETIEQCQTHKQPSLAPGQQTTKPHPQGEV